MFDFRWAFNFMLLFSLKSAAFSMAWNHITNLLFLRFYQ